MSTATKDRRVRNRPNEPKVLSTCVDCGCKTDWLTQKSIDAGGKNRDPGEVVCPSCSASRTVLIRRVDKLPKTLHQIAAMKMIR